MEYRLCLGRMPELESRYLMRVHDVFSVDLEHGENVKCIVMDYCENGSLSNFIAKVCC